jgi:hypothetical protein
MIIDSYQKKLESDLNSIFKHYETNFDKSVVESINNDFKLLQQKNIQKNNKNPLVIYHIKNNKVIIDNNVRKIYKTEKDDRLEHNLKMLEKTIEYAQKNNLEVPDTSLYFWISDRFPYNVKNIDQFPIFLYSRPEDIKFPIFPDNTFECLTLDKKYSAQCIDWDKTKDIINDKCDLNKKTKKKVKKNELYFKGTATTLENTQIREKLEIISMIKNRKNIKNKINKIDDKSFEKNMTKLNYKNLPLNISLDAWMNYSPIYDLCNYLYLLNLPGHYPWSNRLKYLFLMKSHIINVNVKYIGEDYEDTKYISFVDYIVNKKDYHEIVINFYRINKFKFSKTLISKYQKQNNEEFNKFIEKLKNIYMKLDKKSSVDDPKIISGFNKMNNLTNDRLYHYIYTAIILNHKLFRKHNM